MEEINKVLNEGKNLAFKKSLFKVNEKNFQLELQKYEEENEKLAGKVK